MHRSASASRASDEMDQLPLYDPQSEPSKKETMKARFAENLIHLIPVILIICGLFLWFFSHPEINMLMKEDPIATKANGITLEGYSKPNSSKIVGDIDPVDGIGMLDPGKDTENEDAE